MALEYCNDSTSEIVDILFGNDHGSVIGLGSRLGVPYMRAQKESVSLKITLNNELVDVTMYQSSMGLMAISGVIWDCGLLMVDFLTQQCHKKNTSQDSKYHISKPLGNVLELGCGTGICGISGLYLDATSVILTDIMKTPTLDDNIDQLPLEYKSKANFHLFAWGSAIPAILEDITWDTIIGSDVLYDEHAHQPLLTTITHLKFHRFYLSYKKRNDAKEREFFLKLLQTNAYRVSIVNNNSIEMLNMRANEASDQGLYLLVIEPL